MIHCVKYSFIVLILGAASQFILCLEKGIFSSSAFTLGFFQLVTLCKHKIQQVSDFLLILSYLLFL